MITEKKKDVQQTIIKDTASVLKMANKGASKYRGTLDRLAKN